MKEKKYLVIVVISKRYNLTLIKTPMFFFERYFGAAKDLPGVRELFDQERRKYIYLLIIFISVFEILAPPQLKKLRGEMMKNIDANYYGYMDDDDGLLIPSEEKCEKEAIRKKIEEWKTTETTNVDVDEVYVLPEMNVCENRF